MSQSKTASFTEALTGTLIGMCYAMPLNYIICSLNGFPMSLKNNAILTFWMTIASVVRTYVLRRFFNWLPIWWKQLRCKHTYRIIDTCAGGIMWECPHCQKTGEEPFDPEMPPDAL